MVSFRFDMVCAGEERPNFAMKLEAAVESRWQDDVCVESVSVPLVVGLNAAEWMGETGRKSDETSQMRRDTN